MALNFFSKAAAASPAPTAPQAAAASAVPSGAVKQAQADFDDIMAAVTSSKDSAAWKRNPLRDSMHSARGGGARRSRSPAGGESKDGGMTARSALDDAVGIAEEDSNDAISDALQARLAAAFGASSPPGAASSAAAATPTSRPSGADARARARAARQSTAGASGSQRKIQQLNGAIRAAADAPTADSVPPPSATSRITSGANKGIPVREGLQAVYKVVRDKSIKEGGIFVAWFVVLLALINIVDDTQTAYQTNAALQGILVSQEISKYDVRWQKTYTDLASPTDVWQWLNNIVFENTYGGDSSDNRYIPGTPPTPHNGTFPQVMSSYQMLGGIRLRQVRVARDSCVDRRFVGTYRIPTSVFDPSAVNPNGAIGFLGGSPVPNYALPVNATRDAGAAGSSRGVYAFGCMNYYALRGVCPNSVSSPFSATVTVNSRPLGSGALPGAGVYKNISVSVSGSLKCAWHNVTLTLAQTMYDTFNPIASAGFLDSVRLDALNNSGYVTACMGRFDTLDGVCADDYTPSAEQTTPFAGAAGDRFNYTPAASATALQGLTGYSPLTGYGTGGFVTYLTNDRVFALGQLYKLQANHWIDRSTRAVAVEFTLWNANVRTGTTLQFVIEFFASGFIAKTYRTYSFTVLDHAAVTTNLSIYVCAAIFVTFWAYFAWKECQRAWYSFSVAQYFKSFRNLYVMCLLVLAGAYVATLADYVFIAAVYSQLVTAYTAGTYVDLFAVAERYQQAFTLAGVLGLGFFLKLFEYLGLNKKMRVIWQTLAAAAVDLVAYLIGFLLLVFAFAFCGHLVFGFQSVGFHSITASMSSLLRFPLGDFDFNARLNSTRPSVASFYFIAFLATISLVAMNVAIAIITRYFEDVHDATKHVDRWKETATSIDEDMIRLLRIRFIAWSRPYRKWLAATWSTCKTCACKRESSGGGGRTAPGASDAETATNPLNASADGIQRGRSRRMVTHTASLLNEEEQALEREYVALTRENKFYQLIHNCTHSAKTVNNIDLFEYLKHLYEREPDSDQLFVGVQELCELTARVPCPNGHSSSTCLARKTVDAYNNMKIVMIVGEVTEHVTAWDRMERANNRPYRCLKVNKTGKMQGRLLFIDLSSDTHHPPPVMPPVAETADGVIPSTPRAPRRTIRESLLSSNAPALRSGAEFAPVDGTGSPVYAFLYNFDGYRHLRKKLPLRCLTHIEKNLYDHKRVRLSFSVQSAAPHEVEELGKLETVYDLIFASSDERLDFERDLLAAHQRTIAALEEEEHDMDREHGKADKKRGRAVSRKASSAIAETMKRTTSKRVNAAGEVKTAGASLFRSAAQATMVQGRMVGRGSNRSMRTEDAVGVSPALAIAAAALATETSTPASFAASTARSTNKKDLSFFNAAQAARAAGTSEGSMGSSAASAAPAAASFFGGAAAAPAPITSPTFFGTPASSIAISPTAAAPSFFGGAQATSQTISAAAPSLFGSPSTTTPAPAAASFFGAGAASAPAPTAAAPALFGSPMAAAPAPAPAAATSFFGAASPPAAAPAPAAPAFFGK